MPDAANMPDCDLTVVIPNFNGAHWLGPCLASLKSNSWQGFRVIVVDNGSHDDSQVVCERAGLDLLWLPLDRNYGFAVAANRGIFASQTPFTLLLNNDTEVETAFLETLMQTFQRLPNHIAAIQPMMVQLDDTSKVDDTGNTLSWYGLALKRGHGQSINGYKKEGFVFSPSGGASIFRTDFLREMKGFDESFGSYLEDVDLGFRGQLAGYQYHYCPAAVVRHKGHGSRIPTGKYVRYITKNRLILFVKNVPSGLLLRQFPKILYAQFFFFLVYLKPLPYLLGYWDFLRCFPQIWKERKWMKTKTVLTSEQIIHLLENNFPKPHLPQLLVDHLYHFIFPKK